MDNHIYRAYKDVRELIKAYRAGKVSLEEYNAALAGLREVRKIMTMNLSAITIAAKYTRSMQVQRELRNSGLLSVGATPDPSLCEIEQETVLCEVQDKIITRQECLDRSGSQEHFAECEGCETGIICKKLLVNEMPMYTA